MEEAVARLSGAARSLCVGHLVRDHAFHEGQDEFGAFLIEEDALLDHMEELLAPGGFIVEHHGSALFPERWFDAVVVLTTDNTLLYDRLAARDYPEKKISQNVACEIMQVVLEEAQDSYRAEIVVAMVSDTPEQLQANAAAVAGLVEEINEKLK